MPRGGVLSVFLKKLKKMSVEIKYTKEQEQFILDNYLILAKKPLAKELNVSPTALNTKLKRMGLIIPKALAQQRKSKAFFKKGSAPFNKGKKFEDFMSKKSIEKIKKTQFKKGSNPHNTKYDGHERVDTKDGYIYIRNKGKYILKHRLLWETINGEIPKDYCLKCIDGNNQNTDPKNWKLIGREEIMLLNSNHNFHKEVVPTMALNCKVTKKINQLTK